LQNSWDEFSFHAYYKNGITFFQALEMYRKERYTPLIQFSILWTTFVLSLICTKSDFWGNGKSWTGF